MSRDRRHGPGNDRSKGIPPFWLRTGANGAETIDPRVVNVAEENWPWAFFLTQHELYDGPSALEIVELTAIDVSRRLRAEPAIDRNLTGYYRTAFLNRVRAAAARNGRIQYDGSPHDLETNHQPVAPDWTKLFEDRLVLKTLLPHATETVRRIFYYRMLDFSWREIAKELALTEKQGKARFYYGVRQALLRLAAAQEKRIRGADLVNPNE